MSKHGLAGNIAIKAASTEDIPTIIQMAQRIWRAHYPGIISDAQIDYMLSTLYAPERIAGEIAESGVAYFLAEQDGSAVGFAAVGPTENADIATLHKLYVVPELHRSGIGGALLKAAFANAAETGHDSLILAVNKHNSKAIAAYYKWGFRQRDSVTVDIGGGFVMDDYIFEISIPKNQPA